MTTPLDVLRVINGDNAMERINDGKLIEVAPLSAYIHKMILNIVER